MRHVRLSLFSGLLFLCGCIGTPTHEYLDTHPDFAPLVPTSGKTEYQIVWYRSWQPLIHLRVHVEGSETTDNPRMLISYSISKDNVAPLRTVEKPQSELPHLASLLVDTGFWDDNLECMEKSYGEGLTYLAEDGVCLEVLVMDGASLSIAASEMTRSKAISYMCPGIASCEPYESFAIGVLELIGLDRNGL